MSDQGIHFNRDMMESYHRLGQYQFEVEYSRKHNCDSSQARTEFMRIFGRNYL